MTPRAKTLWILVLLLVALAVGGTLGVTFFADRQPNRGTAMADLAAIYPPEVRPLGLIVIKTYREYRGNTVLWSATYFGCLFGAALLSAMAALLLKLELLAAKPKWRNDIAAAMATLAALLVTLSTTGDFHRKWQANRLAAAGMENLAYELARPTATTRLEAVLTRIQEINDRRNREILGAEDAETPPAAAATGKQP